MKRKFLSNHISTKEKRYSITWRHGYSDILVRSLGRLKSHVGIYLNLIAIPTMQDRVWYLLSRLRYKIISNFLPIVTHTKFTNIPLLQVPFLYARDVISDRGYSDKYTQCICTCMHAFETYGWTHVHFNTFAVLLVNNCL